MKTILTLLFFTLLIHVEATQLDDPDAACAAAGGQCSQGCTTVSGGKWVFGKCSKTIEYCCVGGKTQPVKGSQAATFFLNNQAFSNQFPGALVYIPSSFDPAGPLNVVVFIHGFENCVENSVRSLTNRKPCRPGGAVCFTYNLQKQFEDAQPQAILVLPEVAVDQRNPNGGRLAGANGFRNFMNELFSLLDITKGKTVSNINSLQLFSFSGAFQVSAQIVSWGGVSAIREVVLLDSLYGSVDALTGFAQKNLANFGAQPQQFRFANIWGPTTAYNSKNQMNTLQGAWTKLRKPSSQFIADPNNIRKLSPTDYLNPIIFKFPNLDHQVIPTVYFGPFVAATYGKNLRQARERFGRSSQESLDLIDSLLNSDLDEEMMSADLDPTDADLEQDLHLPF